MICTDFSVHLRPCYFVDEAVTLGGSIKSVLTLYALNFSGNIKHIFTFYVIPPHWYDTGGWNTSSNKTRTCPLYIVNIMAAGVLGTQGARTSAVMILTYLNRDNSVPRTFRVKATSSFVSILVQWLWPWFCGIVIFLLYLLLDKLARLMP